jgi:hypothetical protein
MNKIVMVNGATVKVVNETEVDSLVENLKLVLPDAQINILDYVDADSIIDMKDASFTVVDIEDPTV